MAIGLTADRPTGPRPRPGVRQAYALRRAGRARDRLAGLTAGRRLAAHALAGAGAPGGAGRSVRAQVRTEPWARARAQVTDRLGGAGWARHWAAAGARTWQLLGDRLVTPIRTRLAAELPADARMRLLDAAHGQHDGAWLAAFDDDPGLDGVRAVARNAGWWWPYERVAILTERPVASTGTTSAGCTTATVRHCPIRTVGACMPGGACRSRRRSRHELAAPDRGADPGRGQRRGPPGDARTLRFRAVPA